MPDRLVILLAAHPPRRADPSPEADWTGLVTLLSWAEGHGSCGGLRPDPGDPAILACPCSRLAFEIGPPAPGKAAAA